MAYTQSPDRTKAELTFGTAPNDGNHSSMVGFTVNRMQSKDATTSPVYSPISNGSGSGLVLKVPANAATITINSSVTCLVGEDSTYTYGIQIPASTLTTFGVLRQQYVYLLPSNSTNTIWFQFGTV